MVTLSIHGKQVRVPEGTIVAAAIAAEADPNVETVVVGELALSNLAKQREIGSVKPLYDRRTDIFELKSNIPIEIIHVE